MNEMITVNGTEVDPARLLKALYDRARPQGLGFLHFEPGEISLEEAKTLFTEYGPYFDYLKGRVIKVKIDNDADGRLYDRDNGPGAFANALAEAQGA